MKTLLVPTDFSECAEHALRYACCIAEKTNSKIILLHVLSSAKPKVSYYDSAWMGAGWAGAKTEAEVPAMMALMKDVKRKMSRLMASQGNRKLFMIDFIEIGKVNKMVNETAEKHRADLIVMGTHGTSGLNEIFIGSNTEHVVRDAEIPVLAVKKGNENPEIKNIVFATDFSNETDLVFPSVKKFADIFDAKIHLVKIMSASSFRQQQNLKKMFENFRNENQPQKISTHVYYHDQKETGIRHFADAIDADIITLGTHGRHGLARFFKGSIAENLVNHAAIPVLTLNFRKKQEKKISRGKFINPEEEMAESIIPETYYSGHIPSI